MNKRNWNWVIITLLLVITIVYAENSYGVLVMRENGRTIRAVCIEGAYCPYLPVETEIIPQTEKESYKDTSKIIVMGVIAVTCIIGLIIVVFYGGKGDEKFLRA